MSALNALALAAALMLAAQMATPSAPAPKKERSVALHAIPDATIHAKARRYL